MDLKKINSILATPNRSNKLLTYIEKQNEHVGVHNTSEGNQGEYNEFYEIYSIKDESMFLKVNYQTDSYGDNSSITSVQFVKQTKKEVAVYETV